MDENGQFIEVPYSAFPFYVPEPVFTSHYGAYYDSGYPAFADCAQIGSKLYICEYRISNIIPDSFTRIGYVFVF